ncbi:MAG: hypothetical protein M0R33_15345 [Methylomonas sp.]|jgi:hypothetical protein|uniref:hypothetical protein n=1 Tax=Methylomonas sp. TaxID=418 RepID=UPI0025FF80ED|nr:hypothetical protein [Methylomonas sp.]MCK9607817.1 hypothetical protein [Methylomonas sp.]
MGSKIISFDFYAKSVWLSRSFIPASENNKYVTQLVIDLLCDKDKRIVGRDIEQFLKERQLLTLQEYLTMQNIIAMLGCPVSNNQLQMLMDAILCVEMPDRIEAALRFYHFEVFRTPKLSFEALFLNMARVCMREPKICISLNTYFYFTEVKNGERLGFRFWDDYIAMVLKMFPRLATIKDLLFEAISYAARAAGFVLPFSLSDIVTLLYNTFRKELISTIAAQDFLPQLFHTVALFLQQNTKLDQEECLEMLTAFISVIKNEKHDIGLLAMNCSYEDIAILVDKMPFLIRVFAVNNIPLAGHCIWQKVILQDWDDSTQEIVRYLIDSEISPLEKDEAGISALQLMHYRLSSATKSSKSAALDDEFFALAARFTLREIYLAAFVQIANARISKNCPFALIAGEEYARLISGIIIGESNAQ